MESMNKMLDEKMEAAGVSYGQEVQKVDDDQTTAVNGASSKVASVVMYLAGTLLMNAFWRRPRNRFVAFSWRHLFSKVFLDWTFCLLKLAKDTFVHELEAWWTWPKISNFWVRCLPKSNNGPYSGSLLSSWKWGRSSLHHANAGEVRVEHNRHESEMKASPMSYQKIAFGCRLVAVSERTWKVVFFEGVVSVCKVTDHCCCRCDWFSWSTRWELLTAALEKDRDRDELCLRDWNLSQSPRRGPRQALAIG